MNKLINFRMYINFVNDRKYLGYKYLINTQCGNRMVLITNSSVVFVKNVTLNFWSIKRTESANNMDLNFPLKLFVVSKN